MKKLLVLLAMVLGAVNMYAQNLTENFIMGQLPTTADDFQKYQFDYKLECAQDVGYDYDVYIPQSAFDGTNIFPLERNEVPIKSIECTVASTNSVLFRLKADFTSSGKVNNYLRKVGADAKYQFGTDTWYQKEWTSVGLTPCVPNSFACWTSPTRNSKGLIVSVSADLKYKYDSYDRVIEVRYHDNEFVYRYSYEGNSKRISTISVSYKDKEVATARYTWLNDRISKLYCHIDYSSKFSNMYDEYEKSYKYDSHDNISYIEYREILGSQWNRKIYEFNNEYDAKGQLVSQNVVLRKTRAWDVERGKPEEVKTHTRSYTYDEKGNWVRMIESKGNAQWAMERKITYSNKKVGEVDINNIYDDEEVETHATFGSTIREAFRKKGLSYDGNLWPYLGDLVINFRFVVGRDGSVHVYDETHTNKPEIEGGISNKVSDYIESLPWAPATINGIFVNSTVFVSWKYNKTENSYSTEILKDVEFTDKERKSYAKNLNVIKFNNALTMANRGDVNAKKALARMYLNGIGTATNAEKAYDILVDLAIDLDLESQDKVIANKDTILKYKSLADKVAENYVRKKMNCESTPYEWANFCCVFAAQKGIQNAQYDLCLRTRDGIGRMKDINKSVTMFEEYIERYNDSGAMVNLGMIYDKPEFGKVDYKKYATWMLKAAELGNPMAQYNMGLSYQYGEGVKKDEKKAFEMFQKAANAGDEDARIKVVLRFAEGNGVKKDYAQAEATFKNLSVENQGIIADKIFWGIGVKKNKKLGLKLFGIAASNGNEKARESYQLWSK